VTGHDPSSVLPGAVADWARPAVLTDQDARCVLTLVAPTPPGGCCRSPIRTSHQRGWVIEVSAAVAGKGDMDRPSAVPEHA
jgi:hypothetical protein